MIFYKCEDLWSESEPAQHTSQNRLRHFKPSLRWISRFNYINYNRQPVTMGWRLLMLRMEERPPIRRVVATLLNKKSRTADSGWSPAWGVRWGANNFSPTNLALLRNRRMFIGPRVILCYDLNKCRLMYIQNYIPRGQKPEFKDQSHWRVNL